MNGYNPFGGSPLTGLLPGMTVGVWGSIIIVEIIIAIATAIVASRKGRSAFGWFFMGLFLGLIGLGLILIALPKKYYTEEDEDEF